MIGGLETVARNNALLAFFQVCLGWSMFVFPWCLDQEFRPLLPLPAVIAISLAVPAIVILLLPLEKFADKISKHLKPLPGEAQFENVVHEIAIALGEPVESIQLENCKIANVAMLPCTGREVVVATRGAVEQLTRYELQALVAAQFAGMRDRWCRLASKAEVVWWTMPWMSVLGFLPGWILGHHPVGIFYFMAIFVNVFVPRWHEQARDLCADVVAVRTTLDPQSLASAMKKLADQAHKAIEIEFGKWYLPTNPFLVIPRRANSTTKSGGRKWTAGDEVKMEFELRADRAEALTNGEDPRKFTRREFSKRWSWLGRK
ncbi:MAG: hypothetical protein PVJ98_04285 [Akkermansiaceae bacterium]|jgi:Zn-dependent protease with chaperone function